VVVEEGSGSDDSMFMSVHGCSGSDCGSDILLYQMGRVFVVFIEYKMLLQ